MNKHRLGLLLIILIGFSLRLTLLGHQSLWYDEGVTWLLSQMQLPDLMAWTAADIQPPLYYLIIWGSEIIIDDSEWALRFPSAIFNALTIPLLYILARRLFPQLRAVAPLLAATIFAFSPVMIYYSQEARMYTLLVLAATLASYLLLKILPPPPHSPAPPLPHSLAPPLLYALTAAAALYTHYFAAFLLIAHALYSAFVLWQYHWPKRLVWSVAVMFGLTALFFAPWLPTLLSRLGDDPSYWPGALKLDEVLRKILITFSLGETVFEQTGFWLALVYLAILASGIIWAMANKWLSKRAPDQQISTQPDTPQHGFSYIFLLLWLCLPILLILALSYQSPKFNPRYTLLSYPAFILILSGLLAKFYPISARPSQQSPHNNQTPRATRYVPRLILTLSLLFIFSASLFSLYNWFADRRFAKDDFRALAQFVRERIAGDETVLLSSGHLFPVWAYYYGWQNWTPLPWMQRLDVKRVTGLSIAGDIAEAIEGQGGVWLVTWQDEVIDPNGVIPFWLDRIGQRPNDAGDFWGVGLEHWRIDQDDLELLQQEPIVQSSNFNFANQVELVGLTQVSDADIALFWRPRRPLPEDLIVSLDITDQEGFDWDRETLSGRPGGYFYPPSRWPVGDIVMTRHQLPWQTGAPPGLYRLEIGLGQLDRPAGDPATANATTDFSAWDILDEQGRPQRRTALIDFINLSHLAQPETGPLPIASDPLVDFLPIVAVRRSILPQKSAEPGDRLLLALLWQAGEFNLDDISVAFDLIDAGHQTFRVGNSLTPSRRYNLYRWEPGALVLGQYWLDIPPEAAPGPARLQIHLVNVSGFVYDEVFPLDELEILPTERNFSPPTGLDIPVEATFAGQVKLIGAACQTSACQVVPGQSLTLTLYWQAEAPFDKNYTIFTHLLDPVETVVINADHAPPKPTQGWVANEIVADTVTLDIPVDLAPGAYAIEVGLYDAADPAFPRLALDNGETRVILPQLFQIQ